MKALPFGLGVLILSWLLLLYRQRLTRTRKASSRRYPVYLVRFDDGKWDLETAEYSGDSKRKLVLRIKLPAQKGAAHKGSDFRLYVKGDSNEISKW